MEMIADKSNNVWQSLDDFTAELKSISARNWQKFPPVFGFEFNARLSASLSSIEFRNSLANVGILFNYEEGTKSLINPWSMETVSLALVNLDKLTTLPPKPKPRFISTSRKSSKEDPICPPLPPRGSKMIRQLGEGTIASSSSLLTQNRYDIIPGEFKPIRNLVPSSFEKSQTLPTTFSNSSQTPRPSHRYKPQVLPLRKEWLPYVATGRLEVTGQKEYVQVTPLLEQPVLSDRSGAIFPYSHCIPYIRQKIKMWGCNILSDEKLIAMLIGSVSTSSAKATMTKTGFGITNVSEIMEILNIGNEVLAEKSVGITNPKFAFSRWDILTLILACSEITVVEEILQILARFPLSLPLIIRDPFARPGPQSNSEQNFRLLAPILNKCVIRWEGPEESAIDNYLFHSPYKLITAIRMGQHNKGKSTILNQLFLNSNLFSCSGRPGGERGKPLALEGSVEFIWLTKETCKPSVWDALWTSHYSRTDHKNEDQVILLANLHGNSLQQNPQVLMTLAKLTWSFIAFVMPNSHKTFKENESALVHLLGGNSTIGYIFVDPIRHLEGLNTIYTSEFTDHQTLVLLTNVLTSAATCESKFNSCNLDLKQVSISNGKLLQSVVYQNSPEVIYFLENIQKIKYENVRGSLCFQIKPKLNIQESIKLWIDSQNQNLRILIQGFAMILKLPLQERREGLAVLETELSIMAKARINKLEPKLLALLASQKKFHIEQEEDPRHFSKEKLLKVDAALKQIYVDLDKLGLGLEHFLREIGRIYEMVIYAPSNFAPEFKNLYLSLPSVLAELVVEGQTIEILDGDNSHISTAWLDAVCHGVCKKLKGLKVFVLSILGLQSSGKSTLLNALFGCKFPVSVGRCTRGLFMRLLMLQESLRSRLWVDALLILDTEGLGSSENMNEFNSETKDRLLATFGMSISNLTIINIAGETPKQVLDILQIVILTLARLEKADLAPDLLLVQHLSDRDSLHLNRGVDEFCASLKTAIGLVKDRDRELELGVRTCKNLVNLEQRVRRNEVLIPFHPFKAGAGRGAAPSEEYHKDVVKLRERIFNECQYNRKNNVSFCAWHKLLSRYWTACQGQNFSLKFQSIKQVQEYIQVNSSITVVKSLIDAAVRVHERALYEYVKDKLIQLATMQESATSVDIVKSVDAEVEKEIKGHIEVIPTNCDWVAKSALVSDQRPCNWCNRAEAARLRLLESVEGKLSENARNAEIIIATYIDEVRNRSKEEVTKFFQSEKYQLGSASGFDSGLDTIIKSLRKSQTSPDRVWEILIQKVAELHPVKPFHEKLVPDILENYHEQRQMDIERLKLTTLPKGEEKFSWENIQSLKAKQVRKMRKVLQFGEEKLSQLYNLSYIESNWLQERIDQIPGAIIEAVKAVKYETTMMKEHQEKVEAILRKFKTVFPKSELRLDFKWEIQYYALRGFCRRFDDLQMEWNRKHEPYFMLCERKDEYLKKISFHLDHNKSVQEMGSAVADIILKVASKKAQSEGELRRNIYIQDLDWIEWPETIRLRYFSQLALQVREGKFQNALRHFQNPRDEITNWFVEEIDHCASDEALAISRQYFLDESHEIHITLRRHSSLDDLTNFLKNYDYSIAAYSPISNILQNCRSFLELQSSILSALQEQQNSFLESIRLSLPSENKRLMNRLGCLASCPWCGALCCGFKGHEQNVKGITAFGKHHTCHQPQGLVGVYDAQTDELIQETCDSSKGNVIKHDDGNSVIPNFEDREESYWIFSTGKHPRDEFTELMNWFFWKLNRDLAQQHIVKEAETPQVMQNDPEYLDSKLDAILLWTRQGILMNW